MHHIVSDGWSMEIFIQELATLYKAICEGQPNALPDLPIQYADYAVWQRQWLRGEIMEEQLSYWKRQLAGMIPLDLPTDYPRPPVQTYHGDYQTLVLPAVASEALRELCRQESVTLFMTILAVFKVLLYRYTEQEDIVVGTSIANRDRREVEGLIGFFINMLVLRTDLSNNPSFRELLNRVREVTLGAYTHHDLPFENLVEVLQPERTLSHTPLFQVVFTFQNDPSPRLKLPGLITSSIKVDNGASHFDLMLFVADRKQDIILGLQYNKDLFNAATIARLLRYLGKLLEEFASHPETRLLDIPLLSEDQESSVADTPSTRYEHRQDQFFF
jgi:non-ribosomal peptide synthetase component F